MRIAFFGTPKFAVPSLERLHADKKHEVTCVVTQPDRLSGRDGGRIIYSAVKDFALDNGIPVIQPEKINDNIHLLDKYKPDVIVTCAFGQILRENVLNYCRYGVINVHASLLPKYRGSSPIQWAVINGETRTGVSIMQTDVGLDTGDIILQMPLDIKARETAGELTARLAELGAVALSKALDQIEKGGATRTPQRNFDATIFPMLSKDAARIKWCETAEDINNQIRGMNPWPVAFFVSGTTSVRVFSATPFSLDEASAFPFITVEPGMAPGSILHASSHNGMFVLCRDSILRLDVIQIPGGRALTTKEFLNGRTFAIGTLLT